MNCEEFKNYHLGLISWEEFQNHTHSCTPCREQQEEDDRLMVLAGTLKEDVDAPGLASTACLTPGLWEKIEDSLQQEGVSSAPRLLTVGTALRSFLVGAAPRLAAATVILAAVVAVFYWVSIEKHQSGLLEMTALKRVEQSENQYIKAISDLEKQALPKLKGMNMELALLYKDRLSTIDDQIQRCRDALKENPANSHIRRYMLAALLDKKETLTQIL